MFTHKVLVGPPVPCPWSVRFCDSAKTLFKALKPDFRQGFRRSPQKSGWGIIVPEKIDPIYMVMLRKLMEHRHKTVMASGGRLEIYTYRNGEEPHTFLERTQLSGLVPGRQNQPYYLMLLGSDRHVPRLLEQRLCIQHAVGRLELGIPEEYFHYARDLVKAETGCLRQAQGVTFLNYSEEGAQLAHHFVSRQSTESTRYQVRQLATHPTGDGEKALTLELAPINKQSHSVKPLKIRHNQREFLNPRGHVIFRVNAAGNAQQTDRPWTQALCNPLGSALALIQLNAHAASVGMSSCIPKLLDGVSVGGAMFMGQNGEQGSTGRSSILPVPYRDFSIMGDPAACLGII